MPSLASTDFEVESPDLIAQVQRFHNRTTPTFWLQDVPVVAVAWSTLICPDESVANSPSIKTTLDLIRPDQWIGSDLSSLNY